MAEEVIEFIHDFVCPLVEQAKNKFS